MLMVRVCDDWYTCYVTSSLTHNLDTGSVCLSCSLLILGNATYRNMKVNWDLDKSKNTEKTPVISVVVFIFTLYKEITFPYTTC